MMNKLQKTILVIYAVIIGVMVLFPPYALYAAGSSGGAQASCGYVFIGTPRCEGGHEVGSINFNAQILQMLGVTLVAGALLLATNGDRTQSHTHGKGDQYQE